MAKHLGILPDKDLAYFKEGSPHFDDYVTGTFSLSRRCCVIILFIFLRKRQLSFPQENEQDYYTKSFCIILLLIVLDQRCFGHNNSQRRTES